MEYQLIRSKRKTAALQVQENGSILVRAPYAMSSLQIEVFVQKHRAWITKTQKQILNRQQTCHMITDEERRTGIEAAMVRIPQRVAYFAKRMGVTYGRITIRDQKTRWGSCSTKGNLNFNWKLVLMPPELLDYVVVHELAHRREMNHSSRWWAVVEAELPDYLERRKLLRQQNFS